MRRYLGPDVTKMRPGQSDSLGTFNPEELNPVNGHIPLWLRLDREMKTHKNPCPNCGSHAYSLIKLGKICDNCSILF